MATAPLLLASIVLTSSSQAPPRFGDQLEHAELIGGTDDIQLVAYDPTGKVLGSTALWTDADGPHGSSPINCLPLVAKEWKDKKCPGFG